MKDFGYFRPKFPDEFSRKFGSSSLRVNFARLENVNHRAFVGLVLPPMLQTYLRCDVQAVLRELRLKKASKVERVSSFRAGTRGIIYGQVAATGLLAINHVAAPCREAELSFSCRALEVSKVVGNRAGSLAGARRASLRLD